MPPLLDCHVIQVVVPANVDWPSGVTQAVVSLTQAVQEFLSRDATAPILVNVLCANDSSDSEVVTESMIEACRGFVQSVALEVPSSRCTLVISTLDQVQDREKTAVLFQGPTGGYIAGSTFDLRVRP